MEPITYRPYRPDDISAVRDILEADLGYSVPREVLAGRIDRMLARGGYTILVACDGERVVGFVGAVTFLAFEIEGEAAKVIALAVSGAYRRRGIGAGLLNAVETQCREVGITVILVNSGLPRTDAHAFYESQGYRKKSCGFTKNI